MKNIYVLIGDLGCQLERKLNEVGSVLKWKERVGDHDESFRVAKETLKLVGFVGQLRIDVSLKSSKLYLPNKGEKLHRYSAKADGSFSLMKS